MKQNSNGLIEPMEFFKVDKISDVVYTIGFNTVLKFNVALTKTVEDKKYSFHNEYEFTNKHGNPSVTIKRNFDYYLSIENLQKDAGGNKLFIRIGPSEIILLRKGLDEAVAWFTHQKYANLFFKDARGKISVTAPVPSYIIRGFPMDRAIRITPKAVTRSNEDIYEPGIEMDFGSTQINLSVNRLMGLHYLVSNFNMYQAASEMVNYIGRPEFGTNRVYLETDNFNSKRSTYDSERVPETSGIMNRHVKSNSLEQSISDIEGM